MWEEVGTSGNIVKVASAKGLWGMNNRTGNNGHGTDVLGEGEGAV